MSPDAAQPDSTTEDTANASHHKTFVLRLYIGGSSPHAKRAVASVRKICDESVSGQYELEVIDVYQQPQLAEADKVVAAPTLVRLRPLPERRLSGDLSKAERVLKLLDLPQ